MITLQLLLPLLAATLGAALPGDLRGDEGAWLELPDGPAAKVWAAVGPETRPAALPPELAGLLADEGWARAATWAGWAELLAAEAAAERPDPERRAELALLARRHGRAPDAWRHFLALGGTARAAEWAAAVMPHLIPGVPTGTRIGPGGAPVALAEGVVLRPLLPPPSGDLPPGAIEWRTAKVTGLRVGAALVDIVLSIENTGVQIDVRHGGGERTTLALLLPEPRDYEIGIEYLDWMRQDELRQPHVVEVIEGEEEHTLYGRLRQRRTELPTGRAARLPAQIELGGLWFVVDADDPERERLLGVAAAFAGLLGVDVGLRATDPSDESGAAAGFPGTTIRLPAAGDAGRERTLRYLVSAVETYVLARRAPGEPQGELKSEPK